MRLRVLFSVFLLAAVLSACGEETRTTTGEVEEVVAIHPLTGVELPDGRPENAVFVVKVDNTQPAAPQIGLDQADMIVEELVEGGLTRLAVVYYSNIPTKIGHVRSLRMTDIGIAAPLNAHIVASGGSTPSINRVDKAGIVMHMEGRSVGFSSDSRGYRPYNVLVNLQEISQEVGPQAVTGNYFEFGDGIANLMSASTEEASASPDPQPLAKPATAVEVRYSTSSLRKFGFANGVWSRTNGIGTEGEDFQADNLIVIKAQVKDAGYRDVSGAFVPETVFEGTGEAWIFEGGQYVKATWTKANKSSVVAFATEDGQPIGLKPGRTWIALIPADAGGVNPK